VVSLPSPTNTTAAVNTDGTLTLGEYLPTPTHWLNGKIDEFRVSTVKRTVGWIRTSYSSMCFPSVFLFRGSEEAFPVTTGISECDRVGRIAM